MKNKITTLALAAFVAATLAGTSLQAGPITGSINFDGIATSNTGHLGTATAFSSITDVVTEPGELGTYSVVPTGVAATFTPFAFTAADVTPLWTFSFAGNTYSFNATSVAVISQSSHFLDLSGNGYAYLNGLDKTAGTWSITDTGGKPTFTFGEATVAAVPDQGATGLLLAAGVGLLGIGLWLKRKRATVALAGCAALLAVGCLSESPTQVLAANATATGEAVGRYLLHKNNATTDAAYLVGYESFAPKFGNLMKGQVTPADVHTLIANANGVTLSNAQAAVVAYLDGLSPEFIHTNGSIPQTVNGVTTSPPMTADGSLADAIAAQFAAGLERAVGLETGTNFTPPSS